MNLKVKEMVNNNQVVNFKYFRDNQLWYETENGFLFPVHVDDVAGATFLAKDKAMLFMRYINKQIKLVEKEKQNND